MTTTTETPQLYDVLRAAQDEGLVGEQRTALTMFSGMVKGGMMIANGPSRVGKTYTITRLEKVMPNSDIYEMPTTMSPTALYYNADAINECRIHIYPDLASLPEHVESVLKATAEGKSASREVTDMTSGDTVNMEIHPPDCIIVGIASDNEEIDLNDYPELRNRGLIVDFDPSQEQTERILDSQADAMSGLTKQRVSDELRSELERYIGGIPVSRYAREDSLGAILNLPGGRPLREQEPIPSHFTEARDDFKRLNEFIESVALFHHEDRMEILHEGQPQLLTTPADVYYGMKIFGEQMIMSSLNLREIDRTILRFLKEEKAAMSVSKIQAAIRQEGAGYNITDRDVASSLGNMKNKAYVDVNEADSPQTWFATPFASVTEHPTSVDYGELVSRTKEIAKQVLDGGDAEEYIYKFCKGEGLMVTDPLSGETVDITEDTSFEDEIEEATEDMDDVMDTPLWGTDDDEDTDQSENEADDEALEFATVDNSEGGQGTLE